MSIESVTVWDRMEESKTFSFCKKLLVTSWMVALVFLGSVPSLVRAEEDPLTEFYLELGRGMVAQLDEALHCEAFFAGYTMEGVLEAADALRAKNTQTPRGATLVTFDIDEVFDRLGQVEELAEFAGVPESLRPVMESRIFFGLSNLLAGQTQSTETLVLSSILSIGDAIPAPVETVPCALLIVELDEDLAALVSFLQNEHGVVHVSASYLLNFQLNLDNLGSMDAQWVLLLPPSLEMRRFDAQALAGGA